MPLEPYADVASKCFDNEVVTGLVLTGNTFANGYDLNDGSCTGMTYPGAVIQNNVIPGGATGCLPGLAVSIPRKDPDTASRHDAAPPPRSAGARASVPAPGAPVGADEEGVDGRPVGLVAGAGFARAPPRGGARPRRSLP